MALWEIVLFIIAGALALVLLFVLGWLPMIYCYGEIQPIGMPYSDPCPVGYAATVLYGLVFGIPLFLVAIGSLFSSRVASSERYIEIPASIYILSWIIAIPTFLGCLTLVLCAVEWPASVLAQANQWYPEISPLYYTWHLKANSFLDAIATLLYQHFPYVALGVCVLVYLVVHIVFRKLYRKVSSLIGEIGSAKRRHITSDDADRCRMELLVGTFVLIASVLAFAHDQSEFARNAYFFLVLFVPALWVRALIHWSPVVIASWALMTTRHPGTDIVRRSGRSAAQEFARLMQAQQYDDLRARELFSKLGPFRQRLWRARYEARTREAHRLREMVQAQATAMNADSDLGESVLHRERVYRARRP